MRRFGVSRATLLEAVRQLERHGAAAMRRGGHGGLVVANPPARGIARALSTYIELTDISLSEQFEAGCILESHATNRAAAQASEDMIQSLRRLAHEAMSATSYLQLSRAGSRLSTAVAQAAGNPVIDIFIRSLVHARTDYFQREERADYPINKTMREYAQDLERLVECIAAGDEAGAEFALRQQRKRIDRYNEQRQARLAARSSPLVIAARQRQVDRSNAGGAEVVAFMLRDEIIKRGWPVGERLGEEMDLAKELQTSRWVFRQAVRMLEPHAIVEMRRGQRGGLIVGRPDPAYTVGLVRSYFESSGASRGDIWDVWASLMESSAAVAALRTAAQEREGIATSSQFYDDVCNITENRVIALFGGVLSSAVLNSSTEEDPGDAAERQKIAEAILAGDAALSRRRMRLHLSAFQRRRPANWRDALNV